MRRFITEFKNDLLAGLIFLCLILICIAGTKYYPVNTGFNWVNLAAAYLPIILIWCFYIKLLVKIVRDNDASTRQVFRFVIVSLAFMMAQILAFAMLYKMGGLKSETGLSTTDYIYFSVITWTTVGYGDITPSPNSRLITATEAISGYIYMGIFIGILGSFMMSAFSKYKGK